ncbi:hypothetical protein [Amycolatopsis sp. H20-H5]|uniref:hypothetical protein n=1 Tax=Amycolatopsis sp. H20-H5 TaxID=3046309 RepID=UPI002DB79FA0|nr:hypothetical protein [Amycolatopsis sp. H20-H5]MEC3977563.1 hypothetical protein [Amycolatopsis sp. H20-H5]
MPRPETPPPFAAALRTSIKASGLSLHRISRKLADSGSKVSPATLSYWQNGTNEPTRRNSLRAVRALEKVLTLPANALVPLLDTERKHTTATSHALWQHPALVDGLLAELDAEPRDEAAALSTLYAHWSHRVGGPESSDRLSVRKVLRAETDGVDRVLAVVHSRPRPARVTAEPPCRLGRTRTDPDGGYTVLELILDRELRRADTALFGYRWEAASAPEETYRRCCLHRAADVLVIDVEFAPDALPARCTGFYSPRRNAPEQSLGPLWLGTTGMAHLAINGAAPGMYGIRWFS